jgi:hypothetical protein
MANIYVCDAQIPTAYFVEISLVINQLLWAYYIYCLIMLFLNGYRISAFICDKNTV